MTSCDWRPLPQTMVFSWDGGKLATITTNGGFTPPPPPPPPSGATCVVAVGGRPFLCNLPAMQMGAFSASGVTWARNGQLRGARFDYNLTTGALLVTYLEPGRNNETLGAPRGVQVLFTSGTATCAAQVGAMGGAGAVCRDVSCTIALA